jgi:hypothetical protein
MTKIKFLKKSFSIQPELDKWLKKQAAKEYTSVSGLLQRLILEAKNNGR